MTHSSSLPYGSFLEHFPLAKSPMPTFSKYPYTFKQQEQFQFRKDAQQTDNFCIIDIDIYKVNKPYKYYENIMYIDSALRENTIAIFRVKIKREPLVFDYPVLPADGGKLKSVKVVIDIDSHMWKKSSYAKDLSPEYIAKILKYGNVHTLDGQPLCYYGIKLFINGQEKKTGSKESASGYVPATGEDSEGRKDCETEGGGESEGANTNRAAINRRAAYEAERRASYSATSNDGVH